MFATLLNPRSFASSLDEQIHLVRQLGGPFLSASVVDLAAARSAGLQTGLLLRDQSDASLAEQVARGVQESDAEIVAIHTRALDTPMDERASNVASLVRALRAAEGRHRMIITLGGSLAAQGASAWRSLPMESLLFDPIEDPDGWRAAATLPGECGVVLALIGGSGVAPVAREVLLWGLRYAASLGGRGGVRVGFTERPGRGWGDDAYASPAAGHAATYAALRALLDLTAADRETLERELDPRSISPVARIARRGDSRETP